VFDGNTSGMNAHIYNNTLVQMPGCSTVGDVFNISGPGSFDLENNIVYSATSGSVLTGGESFAVRAYNLWYGPGIPSCSGFTGEICGKDPLFKDLASGDFSLASGSPALGVGTNLGSSYAAFPLAGSSWPNPTVGTRPASGAWDLGAINSTSSTSPALPAPPSGLTATVD
jgi:hypothetical protein